MTGNTGNNSNSSERFRKNFGRAFVLELGIIFIFWLLVALIFTPQTYLINQRSPSPLSIVQAFAATGVPFFVWAALTPLVLRFGKFFPLEKKRLFRNLAVLCAGALGFATVHILLVKFSNDLYSSLTRTDYAPPVPVIAIVIGFGATNFLIFWGITATSQAINYFRQYQERELRLAQAQLQVLKNQLHPHFLFNTLNAISELTYDEPQLADQTLTKLSDLLRLSLEGEAKQEVALSEELEFLRKYLEIHKVLLQERLNVKYEIEPQTLQASVPNMMLQPLVENSIRHGISLREKGGEIVVRARREGDKLLLEIEDDNDKIKNDEFKEGLGLTNTRQRLAHLYPAEHHFKIEKIPDAGGVKVTIAISFRQRQATEKNHDTRFDN